jgi:hypothetical protein
LVAIGIQGTWGTLHRHGYVDATGSQLTVAEIPTPLDARRAA